MSHARRENDWWCRTCEFKIFASKSHCGKCGTPKPAGVPAAPLPVRQGDWTCGLCRVNNFARRTHCFKCQRPRSVAPLVEQAGSTAVDNNASDASRSCVVCLDSDITSVLQPCGHACACEACARLLEKCPMCRGSVQRYTRFYLA